MDKTNNIICSSAAEYLTFITATGESDVNAIYANEDVWLSQKMMGVLYDVNVRTVNDHLKRIFKDNELAEESVIRNFRITASDGKSYNTKHYNLSAIIAVGYKVNSEKAVQFRKWATEIVREFTIKAYVMDDERLKNNGTILTKDYFEEQLERIREIRLSERRFYQKITDIYATSLDYDRSAATTKRFFAERLGRTAERIFKTYRSCVLNDAGKISAAIAKNKALAEFEKFRVKQDLTYQSDFDRLIEGVEND